MGQVLATVLSLVVRIVPLILVGIAAAALFPADYEDPGSLNGVMILLCAPVGLIGLLIVSELAGYMSTMDTLLALMVLVSLRTPPEDRRRLCAFHKRCLPFGWWGPIRRDVALDDYSQHLLDYRGDLFDAVISIVRRKRGRLVSSLHKRHAHFAGIERSWKGRENRSPGFFLRG